MLSTTHEGGCEKELVACEARLLAKVLPQLPRATSRPFFMTTAREDGRGRSFSMGFFARPTILLPNGQRIIALGGEPPSWAMKVVVVPGRTTLSW